MYDETIELIKKNLVHIEQFINLSDDDQNTLIGTLLTVRRVIDQGGEHATDLIDRVVEALQKRPEETSIP
jgi:hypothetical protein